jgi:hypothetical protein
MAARTPRVNPESGDTPVKQLLKVLVLYEELGTALRAKRSLDLLPEQLGVDVERGTHLWRLDLLQQPMLAEQAAIEAASSDLIVLSLRNRAGLPAELQRWLNRWLDLKADRPYALAALLDPQSGRRARDNKMVACLERFAAAAHVDFFCSFYNGSIPPSNASSSQVLKAGHSPAA